jgi:HNH endonuclease
LADLGDRFWKRSRLAWAHYYGVKPPRVIAHLDGVKTNDRIVNLRHGQKRGRLVTPVHPSYPKKVYFNMPRGVQPKGDGYRARVRYSGKLIEREFNSLEKADAFVQRTGLSLHGEWWPGTTTGPPVKDRSFRAKCAGGAAPDL